MFAELIARACSGAIQLLTGARALWLGCAPSSAHRVYYGNHTSHGDFVLIWSSLPPALRRQVRPVAAADYWLKGKARTWFSHNVLNIVPIFRNKEDRGANTDPLSGIDQALDEGSAVIFFPEGSRGEPEEMTGFKRGIAILASRHPDVPIVPIFLQGLGRALPRGEGMVVPFMCDMFVGEHLYWGGDEAEFMDRLKRRFDTLSREGYRPQWE